MYPAQARTYDQKRRAYKIYFREQAKALHSLPGAVRTPGVDCTRNVRIEAIEPDAYVLRHTV
jgi:hypothetical protein